MTQPQPGQPFNASPGLRLSVGDPDAAAGTDAYSGVLIIEPVTGVPTAYIVDSTANFDIQVFYKTALGGAAYPLPAAFATQIYINDLNGVGVAGSPFAGGALVAGAPAGAAPPAAGDVIAWASSTVTIPANTLAADTTYRITIDGDDAATSVFAFHDGTVIHTQP